VRTIVKQDIPLVPTGNEHGADLSVSILVGGGHALGQAVCSASQSCLSDLSVTYQTNQTNYFLGFRPGDKFVKIAAIIAKKGTDFYTVGHDCPLSTALEVMHYHNIGSVGVTHGDHGGLLGLISQPELLAALSSFGPEALKLRVTCFMRNQPLTCRLDDSAASVLLSMTRERCRHAVVVSGEENPVGLVSLGDLVAAQLEEAQLEAGVLRDMARSNLLTL
jgi:CBS domain-containing protein